MIDEYLCLIFYLDQQLYAIRLSAVSRVVRMVEVTPLPQAPAIVLGVINLAGTIIPVVDIRQRFRLPEREFQLTDKLIVASTALSGATGDEGRLLALAAQEIAGVRDLSTQGTVAAEAILPGLKHLQGVSKTDLGIVLIHDLGTFLSLEEEGALDVLLSDGRE